jgi:hypothetical protein
MAKKPKTKEPMTITLTPEAKRIWAALAKKRGISRSALLELLLRSEEVREQWSPSPTYTIKEIR